MSDIGVGIIGAGWVADEHIRAYQNNPHTTVRGIASLRVEECSKKAELHGLGDAFLTEDYQALFARDDIQLVSVCSPPHLHAEHAIAAAQAGKHIVNEKPITTNWEDLKKVRAAVSEAGVKTAVSYVLRWNPLFQTIRKLLDEDTIGKLFYASIAYMHGIGPWYGQFAWNATREAGHSSIASAGCHALDGLIWFMGSEVEEVTAYSTKCGNPDYAPYEYDPTVVAILKFKNGAVGQLTSCIESTSPYLFPILLCGDYGTIRDNQLYAKKLLPGQTGFATIPTILPDSGDVSHHPFQGEIDEIVDAILNNKDAQTNLEAIAHVSEVTFAADISARTGAPVKLPLG